MKYWKSRSIITQVSILFLLLAISWIIGFSGMFKDLIGMQLRSQAQTVVNNVQSLGQMVAGHGGIWVKGDKDYPHQYLEKFDLGNGDFLFSKNPALVQREFSDAVHKNNFPASFRMTSLNVMNRNNQPNPYELLKLTEMNEAIKHGRKVNPVFRNQDGLYEYLEPIFHTKSCIACHGEAKNAPESVRKNYGTLNGFDFKEGDLAGVISVRISYSEAEMFKGILSYKLVLYILVPTVLFLFLIYLNTKNIGQLAIRISNYTRGTNIGVDVAIIPDQTKNEVQMLVKSVSKMAGTMEGVLSANRSAQRKIVELQRGRED